jgi:DNA-binding CsgD family transcriptional regulator
MTESGRHQGIYLRPSDEDAVEQIERWLRSHRSTLGTRQRGLSIIVRAGLYILLETIAVGSDDRALEAFRYALPLSGKTLGVTPAGIKRYKGLTRMQQQVLDYVCTGQSINQIASHLKLSSCTIRNHLKLVFRKLRVRNRSELMAKVFDDYRASRVAPRSSNLPETYLTSPKLG